VESLHTFVSSVCGGCERRSFACTSGRCIAARVFSRIRCFVSAAQYTKHNLNTHTAASCHVFPQSGCGCRHRTAFVRAVTHDHRCPPPQCVTNMLELVSLELVCAPSLCFLPRFQGVLPRLALPILCLRSLSPSGR